jgi:DNA-binding NtrC family response regulator
MARDFGQERTLSDDAMKVLLAYDWPGNVRELENCLQRACAMNSALVIQVSDLPSALNGGNGHSMVEADSSAKIIPISEVERKTILSTITQLNGDKLLAARLLGIGKTTLYRKLKEYDFQA